jgi:DNA invertase Pin-like site-specific DNA recombinase
MSAAPAGLGRPLRVGLYARVSTRNKDQDPELQLDAMRDYVRTRGWEAVEYVDTAATGDLVHRSSWARLLADVARRRVDLIMIWKLDRASRSTLHALATLRDFEHAGVGFASFTQPELDTTSATGRLDFTILAAVAEMEPAAVTTARSFDRSSRWPAWWPGDSNRSKPAFVRTAQLRGQRCDRFPCPMTSA